MPKHNHLLLAAGLVASSALGVGLLAPSVASASTASPTGTVATPAAVVPFTSTTVVWDHFQRPSIAGVVQSSSIATTSAPGPALGRPTGQVTKYTLHPSAVYTQGTQVKHRVETYSRYPVRSTVDPSLWPDPVGSVRWYTFSLYLPSDFQTTTTTPWVILTQWKGLKGGTPPLDLELHKNYLKLGGSATTALPADGSIGEIPLGKWTKISVGMSLSTSATDGWVQVVRDGQTVIPKTAMATMDIVDGKVDPIYFKQGIYQSYQWTKTHVSYTSPVVVSASAPAGAN